MNEQLQIHGAASADEIAAIVAVLEQRAAAPVREASRYERWRANRLRALARSQR